MSRRRSVTVTDVSDFKSTRLNVRALQAMAQESFLGTVDHVERGLQFNKWRRQTEDRLEVFFTQGTSVVLNDSMEQRIIGDYGVDAGSWSGRPLRVFLEHTEHVNKKTGELRTVHTRAVECYPIGASPLPEHGEVQDTGLKSQEVGFSDSLDD